MAAVAAGSGLGSELGVVVGWGSVVSVEFMVGVGWSCGILGGKRERIN